MSEFREGMRRGFTLLEVIVALAMLALIAVPAVGLATMAVGRSKQQLATGSASELKARIDTALRAYGTNEVFGDAFIPSDSDLSFVASRDLRFIEKEGGTLDVDNDEYYRILVKEPENYSYSDSSDSYRMIVYEVTWPYKPAEDSRKQLFFTSVFRK